MKTLKKCCNTADNLELCDFEEPTTTTTLPTTVTRTTTTKKSTTITITTMVTHDESSTTPTTTTSTTTEACEETFPNLDKMLFIFKPLIIFSSHQRIYCRKSRDNIWFKLRNLFSKNKLIEYLGNYIYEIHNMNINFVFGQLYFQMNLKKSEKYNFE